MVATTRSAEGTGSCVSRVLGRDRVSPSEITPREWVEILRAILKEIPVEHLRGFRPIEKILAERNGYQVERKLPRPFPPLIFRSSKGGPEHVTTRLRPNAVFRTCARIGDELPEGIEAGQQYLNAPREGGMLRKLTTSNLLLGRDRTMYDLTLVWSPRVVWPKKWLHETPRDFWYVADSSKVTLRELDDESLASLLSGCDIEVPLTILRRLRDFLGETATSLLNQYYRMEACGNIVKDCIRRID